MVDLHLEVDEGILLQATEVERYGRDEYSLDEMVLTNKYIICVYEKGNGLFAKSESITEKIPLSKIKVAGGKVQVMKVDNDDHGVGMQVLFADGTREHFIFSNNKRELPIWIGAITQAITGEQYIEPDVANKKGKKTGAGMAMFAAGIKEVADTVKQTAGEAKQQVVGSLQEAGFNVRNSETQTTSEDEVMEQPEVKTITPKFCVNCGEKLKDGAKFCYGCGSPVSVIKQEIHEQEHKVEEPKGEATTAEKLDDSENTSTRTRVEDEELTERKVVYEGKIHKCPNCGEVLGSFQATCPTCGHEVRDAKNSYSVREFAAKLEEIEHGRSTKGFGIKKMLQDQNEVNETDQKKINLIRSYVIPNTKEDLFEFLVLASSNINLQRYNDFDQITMSQKAVSDAWEAKFEQAYEKAKLSFGNSSDFSKIQDLYDKKNGEIINSKKKRTYYWIALVGFLVTFLVVGYGALFFMSSSDSRAIREENERLEAIVDEVYEALENENYVLAKAKAASLTFSGPNTTEADKASDKWDKTRTELLTLIDSQSSGNKIETDKILSTNVDDAVIDSFVEGFESAEYDKFNSPASENGLGGTCIYIRGTLEKTELLEASGTQSILGYVVDEDGNTWLIQMHTVPVVSETYFDEAKGKEVVCTAVYEGYLGKKELPYVILDELLILDDGSILNGMQKLLEK